ncbi:MAG: hypothetical protein ACLUN4_11525 [Lachnospiraceae bacterium]
MIFYKPGICHARRYTEGCCSDCKHNRSGSRTLFSDAYGWKIRRTDEYVEKVRFEISQNKKILYKGTLDAAELVKARSLGKFKSGQKGRLEFQLEIPREWDNAYALKKTDITWIFAVKENEKKEFSSYESVGSESAGGVAQEKDIKTRRKNPVRTGDDSEPLVLLILLLGSGAITLCIRCFKGGNES